MTSIQQRAALQRQIWQIANDVRGSVDGWDFKQYVLGTLFYRFISENFAAYIEAGDDIDYASLPDSIINEEIKDDAIKTKGYFIYPSQLFSKILATANTNESLNTDLAAIFAAIESSANGYPSEQDIKGLFADFDTTSNRLGNTLTDPHFLGDKPFDAIVSNPPYSIKWKGSDDPALINDDRFAPAGVLAPNLFYGTTIAVNILVLSKHKPDTRTQFIDASGLFKKETNNNTLTDDHVGRIMEVFDTKENVTHFALTVDHTTVAGKDYNLSVSTYVEAKDNREVVDITELNAELASTVAKIDRLRADIDAIVAEIEE